MKYKSYAELAAAYKSGELDKDKNPLILDNDCCFLYVDDEKVFEGNGPYDIGEVLELAGIPSEPC